MSPKCQQPQPTTINKRKKRILLPILIITNAKNVTQVGDHPQHQAMAAPEGGESWSYLIVNPHNGGLLDLTKYVITGDIESGARFVESSEAGVLQWEVADHRWVIVVSVVARKILRLLSKPMEFTGWVVDFFLNLISLNGGLLGLFFNLLCGQIVIPQRGTETFISTIGQLDGRIDLYEGQKLVQNLKESASGEADELMLSRRGLMDLCMMASKLVYENAQVVRNVVVHHWEMQLVGFYNCWDGKNNEISIWLPKSVGGENPGAIKKRFSNFYLSSLLDYQKDFSTQVFLVSDKPKDTNLILVSFRGTEPFDADDWSTDFDYSWYEIPQVGKLHMGFLEALGLGNRADVSTFANHLLQNNPEHQVPPEMVEKTAYYKVRKELKSLLQEHKTAKWVVTGHSLGGALAIMLPTILVVHQERELMDRLLGIYTFGQPRIGNRQVGRFMKAHLDGSDGPLPKFLRVVYCNDVVPRLPYDDKTFLYKHFGVCLYYNSLYDGKVVEEEPDPNFFVLKNMIPAHVTAAWELVRSFLMQYFYGPEFREGWFGTLARVIGLVLPGMADHCPTDYVNSIRLGQDPLLYMSSIHE